MANNADNAIGEIDFETGTNAHIPAWVFLDLQPLVVPVADPPPPFPIELDVGDIAYIHSSTSYSLVVLGVQQVASPFDFAQRVLVDPASYPHITAVHFCTACISPCMAGYMSLPGFLIPSWESGC